MVRAGLAMLLLAVGCRPTGEEGRPGAPGVPPNEQPSERPGAAPSGGTDDVQPGTDGSMGSTGTDGTRTGRAPGAAMPGTETPGTTPGTPGTGEAPAVNEKEATAQALTDLHQANVHELALAKLATEKSKDPGVRSFAEQEVKDHTQADASIVELARKEDISWVTADPTRYQAQTATVERLRGLDGAAFDQAYVQEVAQDHDASLTLVETQLTTIQDPEIKAYLEQVRPIFQAHRDRARQLRPGEQGT